MEKRVKILSSSKVTQSDLLETPKESCRRLFQFPAYIFHRLRIIVSEKLLQKPKSYYIP